MTRLAAFVFAASAAAWGATALFANGWWASPAFDRIGIPLAVCGAMWCTAALMLSWWRWVRPVQVRWVVAALILYAIPTSLAGASIVTFTLEPGNGVSAMGSAVAWLTLGGYAWRRAFELLGVTLHGRT